MSFYSEISSALKNKNLSKTDIYRLKNKLSDKYKLESVPRDSDILLNIHDSVNIVSKPSRLSSGVAVIAVMTAPLGCPHGRCIFCPGGPGSIFGDVPQSYTGKEPASLRASRNFYDSYMQVWNRLEQYVASGHYPDKVELIVMGGTFPSYAKEYQEDFVAHALKGMTDFGDLFLHGGSVNFSKFKSFFELPGSVKDIARVKNVQVKIAGLRGNSDIAKEKIRNETASVRCVALCVETKPDWCFQPHINQMLSIGTTRVELGVQALSDDILRRTNRGHSLSDTVKAQSLLKDSFLKTCFHMMPGLPGTTSDRDISDFEELFSNPDFMPDALKIYPCMVLNGTPLYELWKKKKFVPITREKAANIIVEGKKFIPEWCRVMRIQRDIPTYRTVAGVDKTNLRQYVSDLLREKNVFCKCIRCREPRSKNFADFSINDISLKSTKYEASGGTEIFLQAVDKKHDMLLGFCRLRIPFKPFRPEITKDSAGIREIHVYGSAVPIGSKKSGSAQHIGLGKKLLGEAERVASEDFDVKKLLVISGIGVKEYYRNLGYKNDGVYVSKKT
ncbi:tRNA uridine(34) 5-carboxymethylaminomethyl modification radical SAM/GNAT enzyme Elp3 [Candidatus Woesearchaeota archaeon]|nr:tRNA uridine(34) 5-carboxymethylaminomethyl modification radical SAM/GNAT enzyme Elp3 [Candidatus Woesearchaeota archaeon]